MPFAAVLAALSLGDVVPGMAQQGTAGPSANYRILRDRSRADTLNAGVVNANAVVFHTAPTASTNYGPEGEYRIVWSDDPFGLGGQLSGFRLGAPALQPIVDFALASRHSGTVATTDATLRSIPNFPGGPLGQRELIAARVPFRVYDPGGSVARVVMFKRHIAGDAEDSVRKNSRLVGTRGDTVRLSVPPDVWLPGDTLYVVSGTGADRVVSLKMTLGCAPRGEPERITCNPIALGTTGATGYLPLAPGYESVWRVR
jgi:hypothetical protein